MTLYNFNKLSLEEKQKVLWKDGQFLDNHITEKEKCNVSALGKFFVEVFYDGEQKTYPQNTNNNFHLTKYHHRTVKHYNWLMWET